MTDREAAVQQVAEARRLRWMRARGVGLPVGNFISDVEYEAEGWWPLIVQARAEGVAAGEQRGRRKAAEAIEHYRDFMPATGDEGWAKEMTRAAAVARGVLPDEDQQDVGNSPDG